MRYCLPVLLLFLICSPISAQTYLTPFDFGLTMMDPQGGRHGMVDYVHTPPNILCANYNSDCYPDIARFTSHKLEIFLFIGKGYTSEPQQSRTFEKPIKTLKLDDDIFDGNDDLVVIFADNTERTFRHEYGGLNLSKTKTTTKSPEIPHRVNEADFELVWESEPRPYGMQECAVGDLDNDGINELVTWYKESHYADSAFFLIYKSVGDDEYELFMREQFWINEPATPGLTQILITDLDQNGLKELVYTLGNTYIWEFSAPGEYIAWNCTIDFIRGVNDVEVCDTDQDGVLELAFLTGNSGMNPPTVYQLEEFGEKSSYPWHSYVFLRKWQLSQDWRDINISVGDFDNDGAVDIVSGNASFVWYDPVDIQFFRYNSAGPPYFERNWLETGLPLSCVTPIVGDLDAFEGNELFAGGIYPQGGSAFLWKPTGFGTGYAAWMDTTGNLHGPNDAALGIVDCQQAIMTVTLPLYGYQLFLFGLQNDQFGLKWSGPFVDSISCFNPRFMDMDQDNKMNLILGSNVYGAYAPDQVFDWEQTSSGVLENPNHSEVLSFQLHKNFPNPFNSSTIIPFELSQPADITVSIYDITGRIIHEYTDRKVLPGHYSYMWDAAGQASGIYFARLEAGEQHSVQKLLLTK